MPRRSHLVPMLVLAASLAAFLAPGCEDGNRAEQDATTEFLCTPGRLRCDPGGSQALQRCDEDGSGWSDFVQCDLCHDAECFGHLDSSSG